MQTTTLESLLFPVEMVSVKDKWGIESLSGASHAVIGTIDGKETLLNTCSSRTYMMPNSEIFPVVEKALMKSGLSYKAKYQMADYSKFNASYTILNNGFEVAKKDEIYPVISIKRSYNGMLPYQTNLGYFRCVCSNGLMMPIPNREKESFTFSGKHTAQIEFAVHEFMYMLKTFLKEQKKIAEKFVIMADTYVPKWEDRVIAVLEATKAGVKGLKKDSKTGLYSGQIAEIIKQESANFYGGRVNEWLIYNGINNYLFNGTQFNTETKVFEPFAMTQDQREKKDDAVLQFMLATSK